MDSKDKTLRCEDCGQEFVFTADEQKFFQEKGFKNEPKRCMTCRRTKRQQFRRSSYDRRGPRIQTEIVCAACGQKAYVPFKPVQNRPVYCNECFSKNAAGTSVPDNSEQI